MPPDGERPSRRTERGREPMASRGRRARERRRRCEYGTGDGSRTGPGPAARRGRWGPALGTLEWAPWRPAPWARRERRHRRCPGHGPPRRRPRRRPLSPPRCRAWEPDRAPMARGTSRQRASACPGGGGAPARGGVAAAGPTAGPLCRAGRGYSAQGAPGAGLHVQLERTEHEAGDGPPGLSARGPPGRRRGLHRPASRRGTGPRGLAEPRRSSQPGSERAGWTHDHSGPPGG